MLTQSEMIVGFVLREKITLGRDFSNGSEISLKGKIRYKSAKVTKNLETREVERGKPRE